jgi:2-aminoadipate transaminase
MVSLAGGLPAPESFPVELLRAACETVLREDPHAALQYAGSEGYAPLREWVAEDLRREGMQVHARRVLITSGSQQGLDLAARVLLDDRAAVAVERPC